MYIEDGKLYVNEEIGYGDKDELLNLSKDVEEIIIETNDIHPSILQILFCLSKQTIITIGDDFNKRFFENLELAG